MREEGCYRHEHNDLSPPKIRPLKPRPPTAPSLIGAIIDSVLQLCQNATTAQTPEEEGVRDKQLLTLPFHDRFAALGVGAPVAVRRSAWVFTPSVRLRPLADHAARPGPGSRTASAAPGSTGPPATRVTTGAGATGRAGTAAPPGDSARTLSTGRGGGTLSERPPERAVVEREIEAMRDEPGLVKMQTGHLLLGKVREALESVGGAGGQGKMSEREVVR